MVQHQKSTSGEILTAAGRRDQTMSFPRKDIPDARGLAGNSGKADVKTVNGGRSSFRTDADISNSRPSEGRILQRWVPDSDDATDGSLEQTASNQKWDQFEANEKKFGVRTNYDERIYTTEINTSHPLYRERVATANRITREIERSTAATAHVAEERVMDFAGGDDGGDEEDKYSGVRRQDFPPLQGRENKYTPPARRAPTGQATVKGAPVDPAIISSQLKNSGPEQSTAKPGKVTAVVAPETKAVNQKMEVKLDGKAPDGKPTEGKTADKAPDANANDKTPRASAATSRTISPQVKDVPSATETVTRDVLKEFKNFATQQRQNAAQARSNKIKADNQVKLIELKKFADSFKLSTPVPKDLIGIIAKDPAKQRQIQEKALLNVEEVARQKASQASAKDKDGSPASTAKESYSKPVPDAATVASVAPSSTPSDPRAARPSVPQHSSSPSGLPNRQNGPRSSYGPQQNFHQYSNRTNRAPPHMAQQNQATGHLATRLRVVEQQRMHQPHMGQHLPPTGPANDPHRRQSGLAPQSHLAKLNPNSHEFRPNAFAPAFSPGLSQTGPSQGSSPRSAVNTVMPEVQHPLPPQVHTGGQLIRRKTRAVDIKKCLILAHIQAIKPPQGRSWEENGGLKPAFDTQPTWRPRLADADKPEPDSTMNLTYAEYFEKHPFSGAALATPNPAPVMPHPHHHQLPFHLQPGGHNMAPRQSPHMSSMPMHTPQHGPIPHAPMYSPEDHRMMHSNSQQSYASPRLGQVSMAYPPALSTPGPVPYSGVMQPYTMSPGTPQMNQFRSFSNNAQYPAQQPGPYGTPVMMPQQFVPAPPNVMMPGTPQMYNGQVHFMHPGAGPQSMPGANGYPSPGRPAAPMMMHTNSHQGQPVYGMSPGMPYQQPAYLQQQQGKFSGQRPQ